MNNTQKSTYSIKDFSTRKSQLMAAATRKQSITSTLNTDSSKNSENKLSNEPILLPYNSKDITGVGLYTIEGRIHINDIDGSRPLAFASKQAQIAETQNIDYIRNEINCIKNIMQLGTESSKSHIDESNSSSCIKKEDCGELKQEIATLGEDIKKITDSIKILEESHESIQNKASEDTINKISAFSNKLNNLEQELYTAKEDIEKLHDYVATNKEDSEEMNKEIGDTNKEVTDLKAQIDKYNYELALSKAHETSLSDKINILDATLLKTSTLDDLELIRQQIGLLNATMTHMRTLGEEIEQKYFLLNERIKTLESANGTTHFAADLVQPGDIVTLEESGKLRPLSIATSVYKIDNVPNFVHFDEILFCFYDKKIDIRDKYAESVASIVHDVPFEFGDPILRYKNDSYLIYCRRNSSIYVLSLGDISLKRLIELPQLAGASAWLNYNSISDVILIMWRPIAGLAYFCISERDSVVAASTVRQLIGGTYGPVQIKSIPFLHISLVSFDNKIAIISPRGINDVDIVEDYKDMDAASIVDICITKEGNFMYLAENLVGGYYIVLCDILGNKIHVMHEIELNILNANKLCDYCNNYLVASASGILIISAENNILSIKYDYSGYFNDANICAASLYVQGESIVNLTKKEETLLLYRREFPQTYDFIGIAYDNLGNTIVRGQIYRLFATYFYLVKNIILI